MPLNGRSEPAAGDKKAARRKAEPGSAGWFRDGLHEGNGDDDDDDGSASFLAPRTRNEYYAEFKRLPRHARSHLSHEKNMLRRLLSYGTGAGAGIPGGGGKGEGEDGSEATPMKTIKKENEPGDSDSDVEITSTRSIRCLIELD